MSDCLPPLSVIVPCLNESQNLASLLASLAKVRELGGEVVVVDGGSTDNTLELARAQSDIAISAPKGRAAQMNAGAHLAHGQWLWFLHADSRVNPLLLSQFLARLSNMGGQWGRFDIRLSGHQPIFRLVEFMINARSRLTGIATGDQGLFIHRQLFDRVSGFPNLPLMEDVAICKALKKESRPVFIADRLLTSSRRWEERGILATILLMWRLRLAYFLGVSPHRLVERYR